MSAFQFDLAVLGAGSGGLAAAQRAARLGARVVVFEPGLIGGTCVNVGCVPKKAMWLAAESAEQIAIARDLGFRIETGDFDWAGFVGKREAYIDRARIAYRERLRELGIEFIPAAARLEAGNRVVSDAGEVSATHRLIATGTRPQRLQIPGFDLGGVSDDVFALKALPRRIAIVGSGYIAVEMAGILHGLGAQVTVLVRGSSVIGHFDPDLGLTLTEAMRHRGIEVRCKVLVGALERVEASGNLCALSQNGERIGEFDWLLWALGRRPNTENLGLGELGVAMHPDGHVIIDDFQATNVAGIHAIGDVGTQPALTPVAIAAGRRLADRLFGGETEAKLDLEFVPTVVFSHPPVASCGLSEPQARHRHGDAVRVFTTRFRPMREALAGREEQVFVKLVCIGEDERIVGLHLLGPGVDEMLQGFAVAIRLGATRTDFNRTIAIHPTASEEISLLGG